MTQTALDLMQHPCPKLSLFCLAPSIVVEELMAQARYELREELEEEEVNESEGRTELKTVRVFDLPR